MFSINASFSVYMIHGGTNFEFQNGAGSTASVGHLFKDESPKKFNQPPIFSSDLNHKRENIVFEEESYLTGSNPTQ
jgi:hypothetical protein